jgi:hypothetical protein
MAEFKLGRIRFVWQGEWTFSTTYVVDDVVSISGKSYICVRSHTAGVTDGTFAGDLNIPGAPKWELVSDGTEWQGDWTPSTYYNAGSQVKYGGLVYVCTTAHTSSTYVSPTWYGLEGLGKTTPGIQDDIDNWEVFAETFNWTGNWAPVTRYRLNDFVAYGGVTYVCNTAHISGADTAAGLEADIGKWDVFNKGITYLGDWNQAGGIRYRLNDVVKYGASTWICVTPHTSTTSFDDVKFEIFVEGLEFESTWDTGTIYQIGDTVTYGGYSYIAKRNNIGSNPSTGVNATLDWTVYTTGFNFRGDYVDGTDYLVGDVVRLGSYTYLAVDDSNGQTPPNLAFWNRLNSGVNWTNPQETFTGVAGTTTVGIGELATFDVTRTGTTYSVVVNDAGQYYEVNDKIKVLGSAVGGLSPVNDLTITVTATNAGAIETISSSGISVTWTEGNVYVLGDVAFYGANSYICVAGHTADALNRPDLDVDAEFWNLLAAGSESAVLTVQGDTYFYGSNGPTRLPVGADGQILRVRGGYPTWTYYGVVNNIVYVAPTGTDSEETGWGLTIDKPWKTVRYACDQVRHGYLNRNATAILKKNKQFIMKEISNWVIDTYSVAITASSNSTNEFTAGDTSSLTAGMPIEFDGVGGGVVAGTKYFVKTVVSPTKFTISTTQGGSVKPLTTTSIAMTGQLAYDQALCERDTGLLVDALVHDIGRGGTDMTTKAALAYYTTAGYSYINSNFGQQTVQTIAAYTYLKELVATVLAQEAPTVNYQAANGVVNGAVQIIDPTLTAETGIATVTDTLLSIVTDGIAAGTATAIPASVKANTTVNVKTGTYYEVLPIIIPPFTAVVGDELRSTVISPKAAIPNLVYDKEKTTSALNRIKAIVPSIVSNTTVVPTTGNTTAQVVSVGTYTGSVSLTANINTMTSVLANGPTSAPAFTYPDPTGYDSGYSNARRLILANKQFLKDEVTAYMVANYSSIWTGLGVDGQAACQRDVGYIVDALTYDLTYGGNLATVIAARSYYSNGTFVEPSGEKTAALAVQLYIKSIIDNIAQGDNAGWTKLSTSVQDVSGTAGSAGAAAFAQARIQEVHDTIDTGTSPTTIAPSTAWVASALTTANASIQAQKAHIQASVIRWINESYPDLVYNTTTCARDAGYIVDALCYDMMFGSNFLSVQNALSYYRGLASTAVVLADQLAPTLSVIGYVGASVKELASGVTGVVGSVTAVERIELSADTIYDVLNNGITSAPNERITDPSNLDANYAGARNQIANNYAFIKAEISAYLNVNYNSVWTALGVSGQANCQRDVGYILDALRYDLTYGGNTQTLIVGSSYYSYINLVIASTEKTATLAAYARLKDIIDNICLGTTFTVSAGNVAVQSTSGAKDTVGTAATFAQARVQDIYDWINAGTSPASIAPDTSWVDANLVAGFTALQAKKAEIQLDGTAWVHKYHQQLSFVEATCARDIGYMVDAMSYDMMFNSNFASIIVGKSYYRAITSTQLVLAEQKVASLGLVNFLKYKAKGVAAAGAVALISSNIDDITSTIAGGATPRFTWPDYTGIDSGYQAARTLLSDNKEFFREEVIAYISANYPSITYDVTTCQRDVSYIVDAMRYDLTYGGNIATRQAAAAYFSGLSSALQIDGADKAATLAAYTFLRDLMEDVSQNILATPLQTNASQVRGTAGSVGAAAEIVSLMDDIIATIDNLANLPAQVNPGTSWVDSDLLAKQSALTAAKTTIVAAVSDFIGTNYPNLVYDVVTCERDVGYIIDAVGWDMVLNSNYQSVKAGMSYYRATAALVLGDQKKATLDAFRFLKGEIADVVAESTTATTRVKNGMSIIIDILSNGIGSTPQVTGTLTYNNTLGTINAVEALRANKNFLASEATAWISDYFGDTVTGTNGTSNAVETRLPHNLSVGDPIVFKTTIIDAVIKATSSTGNLVTVKSTAGFMVGQKFTTIVGTTIGNITAGTVYYIASIVNSTQITLASVFDGAAIDPGTGTGTITATVGNTVGDIVTGTQYYVLTTPSITSFTFGVTPDALTSVDITTDTGSIMVSYYYDEVSCKRDMSAYIDSLIEDLQYVGNYQSTYSATLYNNAVAGSELSDMFWVSNSTGLRNCTLSGLNGQLTDENQYGTKRPTAGAFVALNPGFGPNDSRVWVMTRSHYSQNVTMFGTACTGAKIDSALHAGGNKSMVKNDFTTIVSDGIGVWCTGADSLTELVSVFNYYGYAGYLAELGGRIRATNGNSSYGTYGVIAEGVSSKEVPLYGTVDNRAYQAQITTTVTDSTTEVLRLEFGNAGQNYTNTVVQVNGAGYNAAAIGDEYRDAAVTETRIIDLNDDNGYGGTNYVTQANAAQSGDVPSITIAATDTALTNAYNGMRIQITAGTGVGQYANILTYGGGSKIAQVYRDSFDPLTITGSTTTVLQVASTSTLYVGLPVYFLATTAGILAANTAYYVASVDSATTFKVEASVGGGAITGLTATSGQTITMVAAGWDHVIPGYPIANALDLTTAYIIEPRISYTAPGYTATARTLSSTATWKDITFADSKYVAIANGSTNTSYSTNGITWATAGALSATDMIDVVYGGGAGATATAVVGGLGGQGAVLQAVFGVPNTTGAATEDQIASVTIVDGGQGYTTPPVIVFTPTSGGTGAKATAVVLDGKIVDVIVTIPGSGYNALPTVTAATDRITKIIVNTAGRGYTSNPQVTITGGGGTGATATATRIIANSGGTSFDGVGEILLSDSNAVIETNSSYLGFSGTGYTSTPTVTILDTGAKYVAIANGSGNNCYTTSAGILAGTAWTAGTATGKTDLTALAYGNGIYVAVGGTSSAVSSATGTAWTGRTIPTLGAGTYSALTHGNGTFVAIATGSTSTAISSNGTSWVSGGTLPNSGSNTWTSIAYGNGRFVAIQTSSRAVAYSLDKGLNWIAAPAGLPVSTTWTKISYGQGLFVAVASGGAIAATSPDGVNWTQRALTSSSNWSAIAFGNTDRNPLWVAVSNTSGTVACSLRTGAKALGRVKVAGGSVTEIRMIEPGSNYPKGTVTATTTSTNVITVSDTTNLVDSQPIEFTGCADGGLLENTTYYVIGSTIVTNTSFKVSVVKGSSTPASLSTTTGLTGTYRAGPTAVVTDPNKVVAVATRVRLVDGALGNPSFSDRGADNTTATAEVNGDGRSDLYQASTFINIANMYEVPEPGANIEFASLPGVYFKLVTVTNKLGVKGAYTATFQINPGLTVLQAPSHGDLVTTRIKYSQVRLTGHDFLYIGTGNFTTTNYPGTPLQAPDTAKQSLYSAGGRVFFTSTDQDGNFNVGNLFGVQQATGTATLNASAFNLSGLNSLQLGSVELGIGSAIITQFSTDPYFTANSDNIVPTQRAVRAYITAQIGGGQSSLNVNTLTSGVVYVAGNSISTTTGVGLQVTSKMNFTGGIDGAPVALGFFMQR